MRRSFPIFLIALLLTLAVSGCGKGNSANMLGAPASITLTGNNTTFASLNRGEVLQLSAAAMDSAGHVIAAANITYASSNPAIQVAKNGLVCAGTWDSLTTPVVCTPAPAPAPGGPGLTANITAMVGSITSAPFMVVVHDTVTSITVTPAAAAPVCVSLKVPVTPATTPATTTPGTEKFVAKAFHNGVDITSTIGTITVNSVAAPAFSFITTDPTIATVDSAGLASARTIGSTGIAASLGGVTSLPATFTVCPPQSISLHLSTGPATTFSVATGATTQLTADVVDVLGVTQASGITLTYSSSNPVSSAVSTAGLVTGASAGTSAIVASCTPPTCNGGVNYPIYSNVVVGTVTGSTASTVYAASTNSRTLAPIDTATNVTGTLVTLPSVPNSIVFNRTGTRAFIGSTGGLMIFDPVAGTVIQSAVLPGKVLAVSPDGKKVIESDVPDGKVFVYDTVANTFQTLTISGATAADFSPDSFAAVIVAGTNVYGYSNFFSLRTVAAPVAATDVSFLTSGPFAYIAGGAASAITVRPTCDLRILSDTVASPRIPLLVKSIVDASKVVTVDTTSINVISDTVSGNPAAATTGSECPPVVSDTMTSQNFGQGAFVPRQLVLSPDGKFAFVTSNLAGKLPGFNITTGATFTVPLAGASTQTFSAVVTSDSQNLYVGTGVTNDVHVISLTSLTDTNQITVNLQAADGTPVPADLLAVRPK